MKADITLIGVNFYPEDSAIGLYSTQMAEYLAGKHRVEVVTGFPYYPEWEIREAYRAKRAYLTERRGDVTIRRYKQYVPKVPSFKHRVLHLLDFTLGSVRNVLKVKKCDLVICVVPFTSSIALGLLLARLRGAKVWVHIQDFEFDAAIESGLAGGEGRLKKRIFDALFRLEKRLLDRADVASTISFGMLNKLQGKTGTESYFFPNWVDEHFIDPAKAKRHELMASEKFKVLYSGNIGAKQDWEFFLKVAEHFKDDETVEFIVVGAGAKKEWLVGATEGMRHVRHSMPVAYDELPDLLCGADLHILFQKNDVVDTVMPSKLLGMMASARPSVVTGNPASEAAGVFAQSEGGYFFDSDAFDEVIAAVENLVRSPEASLETGRRARTYVIEHFSSKSVLENFGNKIETLLK